MFVYAFGVTLDPSHKKLPGFEALSQDVRRFMQDEVQVIIAPTIVNVLVAAPLQLTDAARDNLIGEIKRSCEQRQIPFVSVDLVHIEQTAEQPPEQV